MESEEARSVEVAGKTVEEATELGLADLGLTRERVNIEVVDPGRSGLLGLGAQEACVRLTVLPPAQQPPAAEPVIEEETPPTVEETADIVSETEGPTDEVTEIGIGILQKLIDLMSVRGEVVADTGEDLVEEGENPPLILNITGKDLGILIGRQGETLQAMQYLTRLMLSKKLARWEPVVVDVESYRARRRHSLRQLAERMADRVASSNRRVVLEAMPPNERRIIHLALQNHPQVATTSIGEGDHRKVTIVPK